MDESFVRDFVAISMLLLLAVALMGAILNEPDYAIICLLMAIYLKIPYEPK